MITGIREFLKLESAAGILLILTSIAALILANSPLSAFYYQFLDIPVQLRIGAFEIAKPSLLWINDGLMAIFFFLIGLELKREFIEGELSELHKVSPPPRTSPLPWVSWRCLAKGCRAS